MSPRSERGVTLLELMVALGVSVISIAAALTLLIQQQRSFTATAGERSQQEAGRVATQELAARLKMAGYGVDPNLAFDFGPTDSAPRTDLRAPATRVRVSSYSCGTAVTCRDRTVWNDGSDEVVFLARDPSFRRVASTVTTGSVTLVGQLKTPLYAGQILQVTCLGGNKLRAYVTVSQYVAASATPDPTAPVDVPLQAGVQAAGLEVFPNENAQLTESCFSIATAGSQPVVTLVDRYRYYVAWYAEDGSVVSPQTTGARPYLMLDKGLTDEAGNALRIPVAPDVEDLQLAYFYPPAAAGGPPQVLGAEVGVNVADQAPLAISVGATTAPAMSDATGAPGRLTGHPANIQAVRISLVVRQAETDIGLQAAEGATVPAAGNRAAYTGQPYRRRWLWETTVVPRNLGSSYFVFPI